MKFRGNIHQLKAVMNSIDPQGEWIDTRRRHQFRATNGGILNWWPSTGTVSFQGPDRAADELEDVIGALKLTGPQNTHLAPSHLVKEPRIIEGDYKVVQIGGQPRRVLPALPRPSQAMVPFKRQR